MENKEFNKTMTIEDFIKNGKPEGVEVYLKTAWGFERVSYIRWPETNPWAVCPDSNGGHGSSYCIHYGTLLYYND